MTARAPGVPRAPESRLYEHVRRILDQGATSSCVGHAAVGALELRRALDGLPDVALSALAAYWHARAFDGYQDEDAGAHIRSAMRVIQKVGVPMAAQWPFDVQKVNERPGLAAEVGGINMADGAYERIVLDADLVLDALDEGCPVVIGTEITDAFMNCGSDATIPAPEPGDRFLGGHAVYLCGHEQHGERITVANSWGVGWGSGGFGWLARGWLDVPTTRDIWALRRKVVQHA